MGRIAVSDQTRRPWGAVRLLTILGTLVGVLMSVGPAPLAAADGPLADRAFTILKDRCYRCHGGEKTIEGIDVLSRELLTTNHGDEEFPAYYIRPGSSDDSEIWQVIDPEVTTMPKEGSREAAAMTDDERQVIRQWIEAGAPFPQRQVREHISTRVILAAMRDYLFGAKADDRKHLRFFTFTHLYNNNSPRVTETNLRLYRAALSKLINSLSNQPQIVLPEAVPGTEETVFVVDLREIGWDRRGQWRKVLAQYPYGLTHDFSRDEELQQISKDLTLLSGTMLPHIRADWFIFAAAQPPLYNTLLDIPAEIRALEQRLGIDFQQNFADGRLARGGFAKSGVSSQNRLLERHEYPSGAGTYWISYDFKPRKARSDLVRFPLGPRFGGNAFNQFAFDHDAGEAIFSLPNGLNAYMLADGKGARLEGPAPADIVYDDAAVSGTPAIVNGLSCMSCHKHGMIAFRDEIRGANAVGGRVLDKVRQLFPPQREMDELLAKDRQRFLAALEKAAGPFLQVGEDADKPIESFPEPIGAVAKLYLADLTPLEVALELDIPSVDDLQARISANRSLLKFGLGTLIQEPPGTLKREKWETIEGTSLFQDVAVELGIGTPIGE